ncbi:MAG: hypothetical protein IIB00_00745 [candidate division Zixibacteria bacterium]|nr:hypothetical protein [candidate division Zixibacteria bacterium]
MESTGNKSFAESSDLEMDDVKVGSAQSDLAYPETRGVSGLTLLSRFRRMNSEERSYLGRRIAVIILGVAPLTLILSGALWVKTLIGAQEGVSFREFAGPFSITAQIRTPDLAIPGLQPRLTANSVISGEETSIEIFQTPVFDHSAMGRLYAEFVTSEIAFVIFDTLYAVTTNGGHNWKFGTFVGQAEGERIPAIKIDGVLLDPWGAGLLFPQGSTDRQSAYVTDDYGVTWSKSDQSDQLP